MGRELLFLYVCLPPDFTSISGVRLGNVDNRYGALTIQYIMYRPSFSVYCSPAEKQMDESTDSIDLLSWVPEILTEDVLSRSSMSQE